MDDPDDAVKAEIKEIREQASLRVRFHKQLVDYRLLEEVWQKRNDDRDL